MQREHTVLGQLLHILINLFLEYRVILHLKTALCVEVSEAFREACPLGITVMEELVAYLNLLHFGYELRHTLNYILVLMLKVARDFLRVSVLWELVSFWYRRDHTGGSQLLILFACDRFAIGAAELLLIIIILR